MHYAIGGLAHYGKKFPLTKRLATIKGRTPRAIFFIEVSKILLLIKRLKPKGGVYIATLPRDDRNQHIRLFIPVKMESDISAKDLRRPVGGVVVQERAHAREGVFHACKALVAPAGINVILPAN
jgi:hypothetical protein